MNLEGIAVALAELGRGVTGIVRSDEFVPDVVVPPHFYVGEIGVQYDQTFGGHEDTQVLCRVMCSHASDKAGQALLRTFMRKTGGTSIKAALEGTPGTQQTLGGLLSDLHVIQFRGHRIYTVGTSKYYGGEWVVRLIGLPGDDEE